MHSILIRKQWRHSDQRVYSCVVWSCCLYQIACWDKQSNFRPGLSVNVQPGQYFLQSPLFCKTVEIWNLHHFVTNILITVFFRVLKYNKIWWDWHFGHQVTGMISKMCEVWKINHTEYGPYLTTDWQKTKGSGIITDGRRDKCSKFISRGWSIISITELEKWLFSPYS